jgi:putative peptide zinc metalloprotease protein
MKRHSEITLDAVYELRQCLKFETRVENGEQFVFIEDPVRCKFFRLGTKEYRIVAKINGTRSNREILASLSDQQAEDVNAKNPVAGYDETTLLQVCQWLVGSNLVVVDNLDNAQRVNQQAAKLRDAQVLGWMNPISIKFNLLNPNQILKRIQPFFDWLFSVWFLLIWIALGCYSIALLYANWDRACVASSGVFAVDSWLWLLITWFVLKVVHETAHGIACRRYGGEVPRAGVLLLLFAPMAFVDVTSMWRFNNRWHRMVVAAAGMYLELFVAFIAVIVWHQNDGVIASTAYSVMIMSSITTIMFNANPLMRFDGYFLLADLLAIPNLYQKGTTWFAGWLKQVFFGLPNQVNFTADEKRAVMIYGILAFLWKISISVGLILAASVLFQGAGLVLSGIGVVFWFVLPILKQSEQLLSQRSTGAINMRRTLLSACVIGIAAAALIYVFQAPATRSAPAIVQFKDETVVRAEAEGFVKNMLTFEGEHVFEGQLLMELENSKLTNELVDLQKRLCEAQIQTRIFQKNNNRALAQAESQRCIQLLAQIEEKKQETAALQIVAQSSGFVVERGLANRVGSFVARGDVLLTIAEREQKEVVVSVDQSEYDSGVWRPGESIRLTFPGKPLVEATLVSVNPRAHQKPNYPSLTATVGGPLPVRPVSKTKSETNESGFELLSPRFNATVQLPADCCSKFAAGQRGRAFFKSSKQSLASYLYLLTSHWLKSKIETATSAAN